MARPNPAVAIPPPNDRCPSKPLAIPCNIRMDPVPLISTITNAEVISSIPTIKPEFIRHGIEVIYLGYHRSVGDIVRAAIQEDVRAIGISSYNGGHVEFFAEVIDLLRKRGETGIKVFGCRGDETKRHKQDFLCRHVTHGNDRLRAQALRKTMQTHSREVARHGIGTETH